MNKRMDIKRETIFAIVKVWLCQGSGICPKCDITRRQIAMRALVSFTLQRILRAKMCGTQLLGYCRTHNVCVCLYIAYIACGSASLSIKTLYFYLTVLALSAAATVANIKIRYDAKTPQFAIFGTRIICVFYSIRRSQPVQVDRLVSFSLVFIYLSQNTDVLIMKNSLKWRHTEFRVQSHYRASRE